MQLVQDRRHFLLDRRPQGDALSGRRAPGAPISRLRPAFRLTRGPTRSTKEPRKPRYLGKPLDR
jgi:hypothetical protein